MYMIVKGSCCVHNSHRRVFRLISRLIHGIYRGLPNEKIILFAVGIEVNFLILYFFSVIIFVTQLDVTETSSTRLLNSNTHQYAAKFNTIEAFL